MIASKMDTGVFTHDSFIGVCKNAFYLSLINKSVLISIEMDIASEQA
jgi:hypothetical protein